MNFSKSKQVIRYFSLFSALLLTTSLLAGCKKDDPITPSTEGKLDLNIDLDPTTATQPTTAQTQPTETTTVINEKSATVISQLNIRSAPSTNGSSVLGTLYAGDKVIVERRETLVGIQWAYISSPQAGWICMDFVQMDMPDAESDNNSTPGETAPTKDPTTPSQGGTNTTSIKGVVTTGLNIRKEATINSDVVGTYAKGDVVTILETSNGWGRTNKGWIKMEFVNTTGTSNTTNNSGNTGSNNNNNTTITSNGSTTVQFRGVVKASELNIRSSASTSGTRLGSYTYGARVVFYEKSGNWGRTDKGWISLDYVYQDGTTGSKTATGTVTGNGLRVRSGPGTKYDVVSSLSSGDKVNILEQFTYDGTTWGCIKNGWICMDYVDTGSSSSSGSSGSTNEDSFTATITGNGVNIRSGAGTNYTVVGTLDRGDQITVTELKTVGGKEWGKIKQGWVCMDYAKVD